MARTSFPPAKRGILRPIQLGPRVGTPAAQALREKGDESDGTIRSLGPTLTCGLPKWMDSDPDAKLKRELDPLRSKSIFKLGE